MDDAATMSGRKSSDDLHGKVEQLVDREGLPGNQDVERLSIQQFHDHEGLAAMLADIIDGADVNSPW